MKQRPDVDSEFPSSQGYTVITDDADGGLVAKLDCFFEIGKRGSSVLTEIRAGVIMWMTMSYIMIVNPVILQKSSLTEEDHIPLEPLMTATAITAAVGSFMNGVYGNAPTGLMPGMGLNAYFSYGICHNFGVTFQEALSCCFMAGVLLLLLTVSGWINATVRVLMSEHLKKAITVALGVFQAFIGFQVMGLVVADPNTLVALGDFSFSNQKLYLALGGIFLISGMLATQRVYGAIFIGIWLVAFCSWVTGIQPWPTELFSAPDFSLVFQVDFSGWSVVDSRKFAGMVTGTIVMFLVSLFDMAGVQYGLFSIAGLLEDGVVPRGKQIFVSTAVTTAFGAIVGTSPSVIANESSAGIFEGARTGLSSVVVSLLFVLSGFIAPLLVAIPRVATAVPLVLIGSFMMGPCVAINWDNICASIPSFITITLVPFTYSIHNGIVGGIVMDLFLKLASQCAPPEVGDPVDEEGETKSTEAKYHTPHLHTPSSPASGSERAGLARRLLSSLSAEDDSTALREALRDFIRHERVSERSRTDSM